MKRIALVLALLVAGCGHLASDHVATGVPRSVHTGHVRVIMDSEGVPAGFEEIALVRAQGVGNRANLESVMGGLQEEARLVGANVVVRVRIDQGSSGVSAIGTAGVLR